MNIDLHNHAVPPPMQYPDAAIVELERVVKEHKFTGVEIATSIEGAPLAHPKFRKVLKTIEQLGCFIFAHPYRCLADGGWTITTSAILWASRSIPR